MLQTAPEEERVQAIRRNGPILLVGNPNVGKSALFGALTGNYVTVSNYPGTTVEITRGTVLLDGEKVPILDSPGTNSFLPNSDDERVTRDMLLHGDARAVVVVGDAKNLHRTVLLALQMAEIGLPWVLCLNMMDEAGEDWTTADLEELGRLLGVRVVPTVAVRREGIDQLRESLSEAVPSRRHVEYPEDLEKGIEAIHPLMPSPGVSDRALALMLLCDDGSLRDWSEKHLRPDDRARIEEVRNALLQGRDEPLIYSVNKCRVAAAGRIVRQVEKRNPGEEHPGGRFWAFLDRYATHRIWGLPILALILYGMYRFVGVFGAGTLVGWMEDGLFGKIINPVAISLAEQWLGPGWIQDLLVGEYGLVTMALTYSLAIVFPIVGTFFLAFGAMEDSGYLPRLAVMVNRGFRKIGLNGKAVLPMVLGLGHHGDPHHEDPGDPEGTADRHHSPGPRRALLGPVDGDPGDVGSPIPAGHGDLDRGRPGGDRPGRRPGFQADSRPGRRFHHGTSANADAAVGEYRGENRGPDRMVPERGGASLRAGHPDPVRGRPAPAAGRHGAFGATGFEGAPGASQGDRSRVHHRLPAP